MSLLYKSIKLIVLALLLITIATKSDAQSTFIATGTSTNNQQTTAAVTIVTPISIKKNNDMSFNNLDISTILRSVVITPDGELTNINGSLTEKYGTPAVFTISGEATAKYDISLPTAPVILMSGGKILNASAFTYNIACRSGLLPECGTQTINVGATLVLKESQEYLAGTPFQLTVNYN